MLYRLFEVIKSFTNITFPGEFLSYKLRIIESEASPCYLHQITPPSVEIPHPQAKNYDLGLKSALFWDNFQATAQFECPIPLKLLLETPVVTLQLVIFPLSAPLIWLHIL